MIKSGKIGLRSDGGYDCMTYSVSCDRCGRTYHNDGRGGRPADDYQWTTFRAAVEGKKKLGFRSVCRIDRWYDLCPECYKEFAINRK